MCTCPQNPTKDDLDKAISNFNLHKFRIEREDPRIYKAILPLLEDVELFMTTARDRLPRKVL